MNTGRWILAILISWTAGGAGLLWKEAGQRQATADGLQAVSNQVVVDKRETKELLDRHTVQIEEVRKEGAATNIQLGEIKGIVSGIRDTLHGRNKDR